MSESMILFLLDEVNLLFHEERDLSSIEKDIEVVRDGSSLVFVSGVCLWCLSLVFVSGVCLSDVQSLDAHW